MWVFRMRIYVRTLTFCSLSCCTERKREKADIPFTSLLFLITEYLQSQKIWLSSFSNFVYFKVQVKYCSDINYNIFITENITKCLYNAYIARSYCCIIS